MVRSLESQEVGQGVREDGSFLQKSNCKGETKYQGETPMECYIPHFWVSWCFSMGSFSLTLISAPICLLKQIALENSWVFSYCSVISKSPLTATVAAFHWQNARLNLHFFVFWVKLKNLGLGTPKFEGIQRERSQLWNMLVYGLFFHFSEFSMI